MNYSEFIEAVRCEVMEILSREGKVSVKVQRITKNNGVELDGLMVLRPDSNVSPTIYLNDFYNQYQNGRKFGIVVNDIIEIYNKNKDSLKVSEDFFVDFNLIKDRIIYKTINYEQNLRLLKDVPHIEIMDLAIAFYCIVEANEEIRATTLIHNCHIEKWNISKDELYKTAFYNTQRLYEPEIRDMYEIIMEMMNSVSDNSEDSNDIDRLANEYREVPESEIKMYVLTNKKKTNGASCIFYEDVLSRFSKKIDRDLFVLPSSIHEVIIVPKTDFITKDELKTMVCEVNASEVDECDRLSDNVYIFEKNGNTLSIA